MAHTKKTPRREVGGSSFAATGRIASAGHLAGLDARSASVHTLGRAAHAGANGLDVGVPAAAGATVRVGNTVTEPWSLAADVADGSHGNSIQALGIAHVAAREGSSDRGRSGGQVGANANLGRVHEGTAREWHQGHWTASVRATVEHGAAEACGTPTGASGSATRAWREHDEL